MSDRATPPIYHIHVERRRSRWCGSSYWSASIRRGDEVVTGAYMGERPADCVRAALKVMRAYRKAGFQ